MQEINAPELWIKDFPRLKDIDHKYDRGHAIIVGANLGIGSTGASKLAAYSALRTGAGLVSIICNQETAAIYASSLLSVMVKIINNNKEFEELIADLRVKAMLIGPGNGVTSSTKSNVLQALGLKKRLVLDADALTVFQDNPKELFNAIKSDVVLTPHLSEFVRLFQLEDDHIQAALNAARLSGATVLLKGHDSIIASPNGNYIINKAAPACLATAGSGDVLAGIITGLIAQGVNGFKASCMACYIHSEAAKLFGEGLIAEDLLSKIPEVIKKIR